MFKIRHEMEESKRLLARRTLTWSAVMLKALSASDLIRLPFRLIITADGLSFETATHFAQSSDSRVLNVAYPEGALFDAYD